MSSGGGLLEGLSCQRCRVGMLYCYKESVSSLESWGQASSWRGKECCDQDGSKQTATMARILQAGLVQVMSEKAWMNGLGLGLGLGWMLSLFYS